MIPFIFANCKGEAAGLAVIVFISTIAISEALTGQLIVALIGALPPTAAVIVALMSLKRGQKEMATALDGKLNQLMAAEKGVSKAEGVKEERAEARVRSEAPVSAEVIATTVAAAVAAVSTPDPDAVQKMEVVNTEDNPVPVKPGNKGAL